jgi:hypothetical protein
LTNLLHDLCKTKDTPPIKPASRKTLTITLTFVRHTNFARFADYFWNVFRFFDRRRNQLFELRTFENLLVARCNLLEHTSEILTDCDKA